MYKNLSKEIKRKVQYYYRNIGKFTIFKGYQKYFCFFDGSNNILADCILMCRNKTDFMDSTSDKKCSKIPLKIFECWKTRTKTPIDLIKWGTFREKRKKEGDRERER